ncbi:MAG: helix-turn-helix domain-containing protein [Planctomycetota bacterium]
MSRLIDLKINKLSILRISRSCLDKSWFGIGRIDNYSRLYFSEKGDTLIDVGNKEHLLAENSLSIIPAGTRFNYKTNGNLIQNCMHFNLTLNGIVPFFKAGTIYSCKLNKTESCAIVADFKNILTYSDSNTEVSDIFAAGIFLQLISIIAKECSLEAGSNLASEQQKLKPAIDYIEENISRRLSVVEIAKQVNLERSYFSRYFKKVLKEPPLKYLNRRRIELSLGMLRNEDLTLDTIAWNLGFCDAFHFSRAFKAHAGISPSQYRKSEDNIE